MNSISKMKTQHKSLTKTKTQQKVLAINFHSAFDTENQDNYQVLVMDELNGYLKNGYYIREKTPILPKEDSHFFTMIFILERTINEEE